MPGATIYDVAAKVGVSISTVSRVLNTPEQVNLRTRQRVLAAIDELGFVPKAEATARARKGTGRIGVLAPFITYPSFVQRLHGVATALSDSTYELVIYNVDSGARRDALLASIAVTRRLDGIIVMALEVDEAAALRLRAGKIQTVLIETGSACFSSIGIDDQAGGRLAAEHLVGLGHRRCGFVGDGETPSYAIRHDKRLEGYRQGLYDAGIELPDTYIALAPHSREQARRQAHELLALSEPPTAIFAPSDTQAIGVLQAARERGLAVPQQLSVVGFDDVEVADLVGLTTIRQPLEESGRLAVEVLLNHLVDACRSIQQIKLPVTLVQRETTAPPQTANLAVAQLSTARATIGAPDLCSTVRSLG